MTRSITATMLLVVLSLVISLTPPGQVHSQDRVAYLFISTSPMDADIIIDGSPQLKGSPLLLRTLVPGEHRLEIRGISPRGSPVTFTLEQGEIRSIHFDYINNLLLTNYSTSSVLGIEERIDGYGYESRITYQVQDVKGMPIVYEEFPKQGTIDILNIAVPVFAVISGLLTLNDAAYPKDSGLFFSPVTITAYTVTAGLLGYRVALGRQRKKYIESLDVRPEELTASHLQARELYSRAQELLSGDELEEALLNYQQIVGNHAETIYMPHALYKIARIHQIEERYDVAEGTFELILERYPLADLYDKSLKALAELYAAQGRYCMGILYLDRMLFADPLFKRYAIQDYRQTLETECFSRGTEMARGDE